MAQRLRLPMIPPPFTVAHTLKKPSVFVTCSSHLHL